MMFVFLKLFRVIGVNFVSNPSARHAVTNTLEKDGESALPVVGSAALYTAPGTVGGVAGGFIGRWVGKTSKEKKIVGAVTGGALGGATGYVINGPVSGAVNGIIGAGIGLLVASISKR